MQNMYMQHYLHVVYKSDGPGTPAVVLSPNKPAYFVGEFLTIQCSSDSNPPPVFTWSFKPQNKSGDTRIEYFQYKSKLVFHSLKTENAGTYTCTVNNATNNLNMTSFVFVHVKNSERIYTGCDQCGYIETCQQSNEKTVCIVNIWMPIAVVCILLSATFAVSSIAMIRQRKRTQESTATNNIIFENRLVTLWFKFQPFNILSHICNFTKFNYKWSALNKVFYCRSFNYSVMKSDRISESVSFGDRRRDYPLFTMFEFSLLSRY